jgi:hypothetical protein
VSTPGQGPTGRVGGRGWGDREAGPAGLSAAGPPPPRCRPGKPSPGRAGASSVPAGRADPAAPEPPRAPRPRRARRPRRSPASGPRANAAAGARGPVPTRRWRAGRPSTVPPHRVPCSRRGVTSRSRGGGAASPTGRCVTISRTGGALSHRQDLAVDPPYGQRPGRPVGHRDDVGARQPVRTGGDEQRLAGGIGPGREGVTAGHLELDEDPRDVPPVLAPQHRAVGQDTARRVLAKLLVEQLLDRHAPIEVVDDRGPARECAGPPARACDPRVGHREYRRTPIGERSQGLRPGVGKGHGRAASEHQGHDGQRVGASRADPSQLAQAGGLDGPDARDLGRVSARRATPSACCGSCSARPTS